MADLNIMPIYTDAYLADTTHLSAEQHGAYLLILMAMWRAGGELPLDDEVLCRIAKVDPRRWHLVWPTIRALCMLSEHPDGGANALSQKKLKAVYEQQAKRKRTAQVNGSHGGRPKSLETHDPINPVGYVEETKPVAPENQPGTNIGQSVNPPEKLLQPSGVTQPEPSEKLSVLRTPKEKEEAKHAPPDRDAEEGGARSESPSAKPSDPWLDLCRDIAAAFDEQQRLNPETAKLCPSTHHVDIWERSVGYDPVICRSVVLEGIEKKKGNISHLKFFDGAIFDAHAALAKKRQAAEDARGDPDAEPKTPEPTPNSWGWAVKHFKETGGQWNFSGPPPDDPDCRCPIGILRQYGYAPEEGPHAE